MEHQISFFPLLLITILAFIVPIIASRLSAIRIPIVVGEILCGIIIGKSGLNLITADPWLEFLSLFGFTYLMFLSGLEIDFNFMTGELSSEKRSLQQLLSNPLYLGSAVFLLTLICSYVISLYLTQQELVKNPYMMTLILSTTSVGIVVPTLKEGGELDSRFGQTILVSAIIADFATMLLITILVILLTKGINLEVILIVLIFVAFFLFHQLGTVLTKSASARKILGDLAHATAQIQVRGAFALMLIFLVLSQWLGVEIILGAFLAGAIISEFARSEESELDLKLDAIGYGFFIPIFFIMVGVNFDLKAITQSEASFLLIPILVIAAIVVKMVPAFLLRIANFSWRQTLAGGAILSARLSLIIAAAAIGVKIGAISPAVDSAIIIVALIMCTISPLLYASLHTQEKPERGKAIIVGAGRVGRLLAQLLTRQKFPVVLVEKDSEICERIQKQGLPILQGDGTDLECLRALQISPNDVVVAVTKDDEVNLSVCHLARQEFGVQILIARDNDPANTDTFRKLGIVPMNFAQIGAVALENLIFRPSFSHLLIEDQFNRRVLAIAIKNRQLYGQYLENLSLPRDSFVLLIQRGNRYFIPSRDTILQAEDIVIILCSNESEPEVREIFDHL